MINFLFDCWSQVVSMFFTFPLGSGIWTLLIFSCSSLLMYFTVKAGASDD